VTMREAAEALGVSKEAIRKRVIRGTLRSEVGGTDVGTCT
jgi:excisionase family DNA binding protein